MLWAQTFKKQSMMPLLIESGAISQDIAAGLNTAMCSISEAMFPKAVNLEGLCHGITMTTALAFSLGEDAFNVFLKRIALITSSEPIELVEQSRAHTEKHLSLIEEVGAIDARKHKEGLYQSALQKVKDGAALSEDETLELIDLEAFMNSIFLYHTQAHSSDILPHTKMLSQKDNAPLVFSEIYRGEPMAADDLLPAIALRPDSSAFPEFLMALSDNINKPILLALTGHELGSEQHIMFLGCRDKEWYFLDSNDITRHKRFSQAELPALGERLAKYIDFIARPVILGRDDALGAYQDVFLENQEKCIENLKSDQTLLDALLHTVVLQSEAMLAEQAIQAGADVNQYQVGTQSLLDIAARFNYEAVPSLLFR